MTFLCFPLTQVCPAEACKIETQTRDQCKSKKWFQEREWRITASRFGEICKTTEKRNKDKLCHSLVSPQELQTKPIIHGRTYEGQAIEKFEARLMTKVNKSGLFVSPEYPYLAATPDGVIDSDHIVEVKCPYNGKNMDIEPGPCFPFLHKSMDGEIKLKETSNYYYQVQGQMYVCKKQVCYFVVYTHQDLFVQKVNIDIDYCEHSLIPKLTLFWEKYLRPYIARNL